MLCELLIGKNYFGQRVRCHAIGRHDSNAGKRVAGHAGDAVPMHAIAAAAGNRRVLHFQYRHFGSRHRAQQMHTLGIRPDQAQIATGIDAGTLNARFA